MQLEDFELRRAGNLVTIQWRGSPKFSIGVLSTLTDRQAFERAAESMCADRKPGFSEDEMRACVEELEDSRLCKPPMESKLDASRKLIFGDGRVSDPLLSVR